MFFEVLADDVPFCQEMLDIILPEKQLKVEKVITQSSERNIYGRSVRLDALCTLDNQKKCNIEVQRAKHDDHLRRVRFNAASIAVKDSNEGEQFKEIEDIIVIYISEFDIFNQGQVKYYVDSVIRGSGVRVDDGLERIFVNTAVKDGSGIAKYMECLMQAEVDNPEYPELTKRMKYLKHQEGGLDTMCDVMEKYTKEAREEGEKLGLAAGEALIIRNMYGNGFTPEQIAAATNKDIAEVMEIIQD